MEAGGTAPDAELEIALRAVDEQFATVELRYSPSGSDTDIRLCETQPACFDAEALGLVLDDGDAYGAQLTRSLFGGGTGDAFAQARRLAEAAGAPLRARLFIAPGAERLHQLHWETLRDPITGKPLLTDEKILFSRYLSSRDWSAVRAMPRSELKGLVVIASPREVEAWKPAGRALAPVDVTGELERARSSLEGVPLVELASGGAASLEGLLDALRTVPDVLYLVCHGFLAGPEPQLLLEREDGSAHRVSGGDLVTRLSELARLPRLVVLASCQSAGPGNRTATDAGALATLGPLLAEAGAPAVLAMQGNVTMATVAGFMPTFFRELGRDGRIDRAMAVARGAVRDRFDWWMPVLFMRVRSGRLWSDAVAPSEPAAPPVVPGSPVADGTAFAAPDPEVRGNPVRTRRSSFIGRAAELAEGAQLLEASDMLTITGAGGVGKTRLAEQLAHQVATSYVDGVWMAELAPLREDDQVVGAVMAAVGLAEEPGRDRLQSLAERLGNRQMLLVLDNCEHLLYAVKVMAEHLLERCPQVRVLATSRQPLGAEGETVWELAPLAVPGPADASAAQVREFDSVRLFEDRAGKARAGFVLSADNAGAVSDICRRLDGLPLAIQLAAASLRHLSAGELATRLDDWFLAGSSQGGGALARHETMYAVIDWSFQRLSPEEKTLFARLAVFTGGFDLAAAEPVCSFDLPAGRVVEVLGRLVDRSLVIADRTSEATRFRLLEPIREFARAQLTQGGEEDRLRAAHAGFFRSLALQAAAGIKGKDQLTWLGAIDREEDNVRAALGFLLAAGRATDALALACDLGPYWFYRGRLAEGHRWFTEALEKATDAPPELRATALIRCADMVGSSDHLLGISLMEQAVALASTLPDPSLGAWALRELARAEWALLRVDNALRHYEESVQLARRAGDGRAEALAMSALASSYEFSGDIEAAVALQTAIVHDVRQRDDPWELACALAQLGLWLACAGHSERADQILEEALDLFRGMASPWGEGWALCAMAESAMDRDDLATAVTQYEQALVLFDRIGAGDVAGWALSGLGYAALLQGDLMLARHHLESMLARRRQICGGDPGAASGLVPHMAALLAAEGRHELAARLLGGAAAARAASSFPAHYGKDRRAAVEASATVRKALGDERFTSAWEQGSTTPMDVLVDQVLEAVGPDHLSRPG